MKVFFVVFVFALFGIAIFMVAVGKYKKKGCCGNTGCSCKKDKG